MACDVSKGGANPWFKRDGRWLLATVQPRTRERERERERGVEGVGAAYKCISAKGWPNNALVQCALDMITGNHPIITFCTSKT